MLSENSQSVLPGESLSFSGSHSCGVISVCAQAMSRFFSVYCVTGDSMPKQ